jgi:hypothetical protein
MADWLVGGDGWPPSRLPPATGRPPPVPATRWTSATHQLRVGGLLSPFGDALLGQRLAQPGMLVVHVAFPFPQLNRFLSDLGESWCRWPAQDGARLVAPNPAPAIRRRSAIPHLWSLGPYGRRFPPAGHAR